jgi:hypothetical protein
VCLCQVWRCQQTVQGVTRGPRTAMAQPDGRPIDRRPRATFAKRATLNQGDISKCNPDFKVSGSRRRFTELHEAVLMQNHQRTCELVLEKPALCRVMDEGGNLPIHLAAQIVTPSEVVGVIIDGYPEALVLRNNDGHFPGTLAQRSPDQHRDVKNMMQDGRTNKSGNWVYTRYEKARLTAATEWFNNREARKCNADAVRPEIAGYVQPRNKAVFLSAHASAR